jgi:hypothetical protein
MSYRIAGRVSISPTTSGVVVARGGESGGFTLFVLDGSIFFEVNELGEAHRLSITCESTGMFDVEATTDRVGSGATMTLTVGSALERLEIDSYYGASFMGLHVGRDPRSPVSPLYRDRVPFECPPETIEALRIEFFEPAIPPPMGELDQLPPQ